MSIGKNIKRIRESKDIKQWELAKACGTKAQRISEYEREIRNPKIEMQEKIALALGVRLEDIRGIETFDSGEEFEKRRKELLAEIENKKTQELTVIHTSYEGKMESLMKKLNNDGKDKAIEQVELLTLIERYTKK